MKQLADLIAQFHDGIGRVVGGVAMMAFDPFHLNVIIGTALALGDDAPVRTGGIHDDC